MSIETTNKANPELSVVKEADFEIKIRNLLKTTSDLIYFKDLNSVFTLSSDSTTLRLSVSKDNTLVGKSDFDFFDFDCATKFFEDEQEIIRTGKPIIGQAESEVRNGKTTWVCSSKLPLRDTDGNIIGIYGISRDITEQKQTELKLTETNQRLVEASRRAGMAEIATNVIHNVGNVLTSVKVSISESSDICSGFPIDKIGRVADLIEQHGCEEGFFEEGNRGSHLPNFLRKLEQSFSDERAKMQQELSDTRRHLDHITSIVAQQQKHATASKVIERIDLSALISDGIMMSSGSLKNLNITVERDFEEGLIVETDKHQVLQIIVNLIRNAKHACLDSDNSSGLIRISAGNNNNDSFSISVTDNGIGIAQENIVNLFTYGFTTREKGKGFGLHSCANVARELGGSIVATSDGPGKGATFVLTLPGKLK